MSQLKMNMISPDVNRQLSISRVLTLVLALTVVAVSVVTVGLSYFFFSQKLKTQLAQKADEYIASLPIVLEIPVWDLDEVSIMRTGDAYSHNELVEDLKISDDKGNAYFDFKRGHSTNVISREARILHQGQTIGLIELSLSADANIEMNRSLLLSGLVTLLAVVFVLVVVTGIFSRMLMQRLLNRLGLIVNRYASSKYDTSDQSMLYVEFQPLMDVLGKMGNKIESQMNELREAEKKYRGIFENAVEGIFQTTPAGRFLSANPSMARILGYDDVKELVESSTNIGQEIYVDPEQRNELLRLIEEGETVTGFEVQLYRRDRNIIWVSIHARPIFDENGQLAWLEGIFQDITERKRAEVERLSLEQRFFQAQKMESIGRLAGGVAHDFNNMLAVITGYSDILMMGMTPGNKNYEHVMQISQAAQRSADLTRQLLAFARKQTVSPKVLDLNDTVSGMISMLRRLIGEDIELSWLPGKDLLSIKIDPSQIDQVLANLCVNARDAITGVGKVIIQTENVNFDEEHCADIADAMPGKYIMMSVQDNGCGMKKEILDHIFEPFFTTKAIGRGTGLGLATVYGIAKQNNGFISVSSEEGQGTVFRIYLPAYDDRDITAVNETGPDAVAQDIGGTVLLVEDEPMILLLGKRMLEQIGYTVLSSMTPGEAIRIAKEKGGDINLVITDVIMPEMSGRDLAEQLSSIIPEIKCLFISGYTSDIIGERGVLTEGVHFLQKPFTYTELASAVKSVLEKKL
jgi:PAS domain S-box-containing protein